MKTRRKKKRLPHRVDWSLSDVRPKSELNDKRRRSSLHTHLNAEYLDTDWRGTTSAMHRGSQNRETPGHQRQTTANLFPLKMIKALTNGSLTKLTKRISKRWEGERLEVGHSRFVCTRRRAGTKKKKACCEFLLLANAFQWLTLESITW